MELLAKVTIRRMIIAVSIMACVIGAALAWSVEPNSAGTVLAGWAALYGIPLLLIVGRKVSRKSSFKIGGKIVLFGLPAACLSGLLGFVMSGYVGLVGGFVLAVLLIGLMALFAMALIDDKAVTPGL